MYALLTAGPVLHCHGLEEAPGHEDHCQGCQWTHFKSGAVDKINSTITVYIELGDANHKSTFYFPLTPDSVLHNRAPPSLFS